MILILFILAYSMTLFYFSTTTLNFLRDSSKLIANQSEILKFLLGLSYFLTAHEIILDNNFLSDQTPFPAAVFHNAHVLSLNNNKVKVIIFGLYVIWVSKKFTCEGVLLLILARKFKSTCSKCLHIFPQHKV